MNNHLHTSRQGMAQPSRPRRLLSLREVIDRVGLQKTAIYDRIKDGTFPRQVRYGRTVRWVEHEVDAWIDAHIQVRDEGEEATPRPHDDRTDKPCFSQRSRKP